MKWLRRLFGNESAPPPTEILEALASAELQRKLHEGRRLVGESRTLDPNKIPAGSHQRLRFAIERVWEACQHGDEPPRAAVAFLRQVVETAGGAAPLLTPREVSGDPVILIEQADEMYGLCLNHNLFDAADAVFDKQRALQTELNSRGNDVRARFVEELRKVVLDAIEAILERERISNERTRPMRVVR